MTILTVGFIIHRSHRYHGNYIDRILNAVIVCAATSQEKYRLNCIILRWKPIQKLNPRIKSLESFTGVGKFFYGSYILTTALYFILAKHCKHSNVSTIESCKFSAFLSKIFSYNSDNFGFFFHCLPSLPVIMMFVKRKKIDMRIRKKKRND